MPLKKHSFNDDEEAIFDEAVIYKRGEYWQMRMWLAKEGKYARFSLKTRNKSTAIDKAKLHYHELKAKELAGKTYFSITTKIGGLRAWAVLPVILFHADCETFSNTKFSKKTWRL